MTSRNPDGIEDLPSPDCSDVAYGSQRLKAIIGPSLDPVCGTDDLSFHLVLELPATKTPISAQTSTRAELDDLGAPPHRSGLRGSHRQCQASS